jgi:hypothetical protein
VCSITKLLYAIAFQVGWFICILTDNPTSLAYTIVFVGVHFWFLSRNKISRNDKPSFKKEVLWLLIVVSGGGLLETISFSAGFLHNATSITVGYLSLPPLWLLNLWLLFAIALRTFLSPLLNRMKLTFLLIAVAIPLNYYAGAALNSHVAVNDPYIINLALISLLWMGLLWLLNYIKSHYFGDTFNAR